MVVEAELFPAIFPSLKDSDEYVRKNVATLVREVCKHTPELAQMIVNAGGVAALVDYVNASKDNAAMPGIMALGYISVFNERLASAVISFHGIEPIMVVFRHKSDPHIRAACAWYVSCLTGCGPRPRRADRYEHCWGDGRRRGNHRKKGFWCLCTQRRRNYFLTKLLLSPSRALGQIGRHTSQHAEKVAEANAFPLLLEASMDEAGGVDLQSKVRPRISCLRGCERVETCFNAPPLRAGEACPEECPPKVHQPPSPRGSVGRCPARDAQTRGGPGKL